MPSVDILNLDKKKVGSMNLRDDVFAVEINHALIHQVIKAQLANQRQGTHKTKVKSEVRGGGKKPFRQKGTGNARQGSTRSPLLVGGGQNFGPQPRDYRQFTPKEMVRGALRGLLTDRLKAEHLIVIDQFAVAQPKTKLVADVLNKKLMLGKTLVVDQPNANLERAGRNVKNVKFLHADKLNAYDVAKYDYLVITQAAVKTVEDRLTKDGCES